MDPHLRRDPQYQNFVTVFRGFAYVGKVLEPYTRAGLQRVHQKAYRAAARHPPCLQQCSQLYGRVTIRWCAACKTWMNALVQNRRGQFRNWENTKSWDWPGDYETITSVYLPSLWNMGDVQLNEFSTACHIWTSCKEFDISNVLLRRLREFRNKEYGHNPNLKVDDAEKTNIFDALKSLMRNNDVQAYINVGQCIQDLNRIAAGDELEDWTDEINERLGEINEQLETQSDRQTTFITCLEVCISKVDKDTVFQNESLGALNKLSSQLKNVQKNLANVKWTLLILIVAIVVGIVFAILYATWPPYQSAVWKYTEYEECVSERYSHPFPQDLPLLPYFKEHSLLVGRKWLFNEIENSVLGTDTSLKGVLITADIGYGKSAIVKHLLCTGQTDKTHSIRSHIVAYHLCRFDVPVTKDPQRFIYRMVGFLSTKFPEFGSIISTLPESAVLYNYKKCRRHIIACFDQGVLIPLLDMKSFDSGTQIIVIDALDECFDHRSSENEVYNLIKARYKKLPNWIKFIITSRNISLVNDINRLKRYHLYSGDQRNMADIKTYIEHKVFEYPQVLKTRQFDKLLDQSEGNFLFIVHLVEYLSKTNETNEVTFPATLSEVYEMNFERNFPNIVEYDSARVILEIIIASLHPLSIQEVVHIIHTMNISAAEVSKQAFEKLAFCFRSVQEITLVHQSLGSWLTSDDNLIFRISAKQGHYWIARYLLERMNHSTVDIVNIAIHVVEANNPSLIDEFIEMCSSQIITNSAIHMLVWKSDSVAALKMISKMQVGIDELNEGGVTPAFIAAARGHLHQLKFLQSRGANLAFKVNDSYVITSSADVESLKHEYYAGYGLIHIATHFGHTKIIEFLLQHDKSMVYHKTGTGLSVTEIACENGYLNLVKLFLSLDTYTGNCMHYAAKSGHTHIVKNLYRMNVNATCIPKADSINALTELKVGDSFELIFSNTPVRQQEPLFNIYDSWWIVYQESPLHSAIKSKSSDMAFTLIKYYPHLVECVDAFGITPLLLSVIENSTNVFETLIQRVTKDICQTVSDVINVTSDLVRPICPAGANYAHLDGIYGRFHMTDIINQRGIDIEWLMPDKQSISSVHYAACHGNMFYLRFMYGKKSFSDIRSSNRSTPYHSAAICGSYNALFFMTGSLKDRIPSVLDISNRTPLHYIFMREVHGNLANADQSEQTRQLDVLEIVLKSGFSIGSNNSYMRNCVHYALKNGHFVFIEFLYEHFYTAMLVFLEVRDIDGLSPVEYAIRNAAVWNKDKHVKPYNHTFFDVFKTRGSVDNIMDHLNAWEAGLVKVLQSFTDCVADHFITMLTDIITKSPYLTAYVLVHLEQRISQKQIQKHLFESISHSPPTLSLHFIARYHPNLLSVCNTTPLESPFHFLLYNYSVDRVLKDFDLSLVFGDPPEPTTLSCVDSEGYNSFHYALKGGNIVVAIRAFDIGVSVINAKLSIESAVRLIVLAKPSQTVPSFADQTCYDQFSCIDDLLHKVLMKYASYISLSSFCNERYAGLSLIHLMAANGLNISIDFMRIRFGSKIIECANRDGITPFYLWNLFNKQTLTEPFMQTSDRMPQSKAEKSLLLGLLFDFPFGVLDGKPLMCIWKKYRFIKQKLAKCFPVMQTSIRNAYQHFYFDEYPVFIQSMNTFFTLVIKAINVHIVLEKALFFQKRNISDVLLEVKFWANHFRERCDTMQLPFNYPLLQNLISGRFHIHNCETKGLVSSNPSCIHLHNEFNHMLHKVFTYTSTYVFEYLCFQSSTNTTFTDFMRNRLKKLNYSPFVYYENRKMFKGDAFVFSRLHQETIFRHRYLRILKKTAKYQSMKTLEGSSRSKMTSGMGETLEWKPTLFSPIKPFEDIKKHLNVKSYSQNED